MVAMAPPLPNRAVGSRWVLAAGVSAGPGTGARNVALAVRTGWHEVMPLPFSDGTVLGVASPSIPLAAPRRERLRALGARALADAAQRLGLGPLPMVLALPAPFEQDDLGDPTALAREIAGAAEAVDPRNLLAFVGANAASLALTRAFELLDQAQVPAVIVGAVDSLVTPAAIAALVALGRVTPSGWQGGPSNGGVLPGEGAAFIVLSKGNALKGQAIGELTNAIAEARTPNAEDDLLLSCLQRASANCSSIWLVSDVTGETAQIVALGDALRELKARRAIEQGLSIRHEPLQGSLGELGIAGLFTALAMGCATFSLGAVAEDALVLAIGVGRDFVQTLTVRAAGLQPTPPSQRPWRATTLSDLARALGPISMTWAREIARSLHLLSPRLQAELGEGRRAIATLADEVADAPITDALLGKVGELEQSSRALERAANRAARSLSRRGKPPADFQVIAREAGGLAERAKRERSSVIAAVARAGAAGGAEPRDQGFVISGGFPAPIAMPFAPGRLADPTLSPLGADQADEEEESTDGEDESFDEVEETTTSESARIDHRARPPAATEVEGEALESVQTALEVISSGWRLRRPPSDVPWSPFLGEVDQGILCHLDWLHALVRPRAEGGSYDAGSSVAAELRGGDSPLDPGRAFANALVLSCSTDPRLVRAAVMKAREAPNDLCRPYADALSLSSSPNLAPFLRELGLAGDRASAAIALEVMARRRSASVGVVAPLLFHESADIRALAARASGFATEAEPAIMALESRMSTESDKLAFAEMLIALLRLRSPFAEQSLVRAFGDSSKQPENDRARQGRNTLSLACAALGREQELAPFIASAKEPEEIAIIGWFGRVTSIEHLLKWLTSRDRDVAQAAGRSLSRILGLVVETFRGSQKLTQGNVTAIDEDDLIVDTELYRTYWLREARNFDPRTKYRFGRPFEPMQAMRELGGRALQSDRRRCELELSLAPQGAICRDVEDWTALQLHALGALD